MKHRMNLKHEQIASIFGVSVANMLLPKGGSGDISSATITKLYDLKGLHIDSFLPHQMSMIYIIEGGGVIKVGVSSQVDKRLKSIQANSPAKIYLRRLFVTSSLTVAYKVERAMHRRLMAENMHKHGEWFDVDFKSADVHLKDVAKKYSARGIIKPQKALDFCTDALNDTSYLFLCREHVSTLRILAQNLQWAVKLDDT